MAEYTKFPALPPPNDANYASAGSVEAIVEIPSQNMEPTDDKNKVYGRDLNASDLLLLGVNKSLKKIMADEYGMSENFEWEYPEAFSTTSRKVIVASGEDRYFVKEKPKYCCNPYSLALAANFQQYISTRTDFVPRIIQTESGNPYLQVGDAIFFTTEFKAGSIFNASLQDIENAGAALGIIHTLSSGFTFSDPHYIRASDDSLEFVNLANNLDGAEHDAMRPKVINELTAIVQKYDDQLDNEDTTYIVNHGDYAPFNLVYGTDGQVIAVNDFDNVNFRPRTRDIAGAVLSFCDGLSYAGATSTLRKPIAVSLNLEKVNAFLKGYFANSPKLSNQEKSNLVGEMCVRWVKIMTLGIVRGDFNYKEVLEAMQFPSFIEDKIPQILNSF